LKVWSFHPKISNTFGINFSSDATDKQKSYLVRLGYEGDLDDLTKDEASNQISILKDRIYG